MNHAQQIDAILAIHALKARYFRLMDTKDWNGLEQVFTHDVVTGFRESAGSFNEALLIRGAVEYVANLAPILQFVTTVHHGHTPEITIETPESASGIWAMEDKLWVHEGSPLPFSVLHGFGHYHERYRCVRGDWKISEIRLSRLHLEVS